MVADAVKPKVLLIDDDPLIHRLYAPHIERAGYEVISLSDGGQALEIAMREQPRVCVIDMMMPGTDGLGATVVLKAATSTKHIPIIAISANLGYHGLQQQLQSAGVEVFLSKPFSPAKLVSEICRLSRGEHACVAGGGQAPR